MGTYMKKKEKQYKSLIDVVFSWSLGDILNQNLYKDKVKEIPMTHKSPNSYLNSFLIPLIEETRVDLSSSLEIVSRAPYRVIQSIEISERHKPPYNLLYDVSFMPLRDVANDEGNCYKPEFGDLIALSDIVRPKWIDDLNKSQISYLVALVTEGDPDYPDQVTIFSSMPIVLDKEEKEERTRKYGISVYLTNMVTNIRIWKSPRSELGGESLNIIQKVLRPNPEAETDCISCAQQAQNVAISNLANAISSFNLDDSQKKAVIKCIQTSKCNHRNSIKLIWGPPGTGKTKTVASLLFALLKMKCKTLTCAPTNIAVIGVTKRLMSIVNTALEYDTYGLGDIALFENGERMKINDHDDLFDVFLKNRVEILSSCFAPLTRWRSTLESTISLLENPKELYRMYSEKQKNKDKEENLNENDESFNYEVEDLYDRDFRDTDTKKWRQSIARSLEENKAKRKEKNDKKKSNRKNDNVDEKRDDEETIETFEEFFKARFKHLRGLLMFLITNMYTHMPSSFISMEQAKKMIS